MYNVHMYLQECNTSRNSQKEGQLPQAFHDKAQSYLLLLCNSHFSGVGNQLATHNCLLVGGDCLLAVELYV